MLKYGRSEGARKVYARAFELYRYAMGLVIAVLLARLVLPGGYEAWWNWLGDTNLTDPKRLLRSRRSSSSRPSWTFSRNTPSTCCLRRP
jgi:hypothetical protein